MPDYQKGKIYKIVSDSHPQDVYYGSTCQSLSCRMSGHRSEFKLEINRTCCNTIITYGDAKIFLVEKFPCDSKEELLQRERHYIENNKCINKRLPIISEEEKKKKNVTYNQAHKEESKQACIKYELSHKEERSARKRERVQCECGMTVSQHSLERHKTRQLHLDNMNGIVSPEHKDNFVTCECGARVASTSLQRHRKRQLHKNLMDDVLILRPEDMLSTENIVLII